MSREKEQEQKRENIREQADSQGTDTKQSPLTEEVLKKQVHSEERSLPEPERQAEDPARGEDLKPQEKKSEQDAAVSRVARRAAFALARRVSAGSSGSSGRSAPSGAKPAGV